MYTAQLEIRVRYVETDQMGVAHHTNYFSWMEAARAELMRKYGMSYRQLEKRGFLLPVKEAFCRYRSSVQYDDIVVVEAELLELKGASIKIGYRIWKKSNGSDGAEGYTLHPFTDKNGKVVKTPSFFRELFQ
ncbi:MAG: acyl-CoA thioesterase [Spirochaetota bacterium]